MQKSAAGTTKAEDALATYSGSCFVVKLGGRPLNDLKVLDTLAADLAILSRGGVRVVIVHGGGPQLSEMSDRLGITTKKINGRRVTCDETLKLAKMVFAGEISTDIVAALRRHRIRGVGLSGVDGGIINAARRSPVQMTNRETGQEEVVDFKHVGDIYGVDPTILNLMLDNGFIPVVASLAADEDGQVFNINADTIAADIAIALGAKKLFMMSDVPGVLRDVQNRSSRISEMTVDDARSFIRSGAVGDGMIPKLDGAIRTIEGGVFQYPPDGRPHTTRYPKRSGSPGQSWNVHFGKRQSIPPGSYLGD